MNLGMMLVLQKEPHVSCKHWGTFHSCQAEKQEVAVTDLAQWPLLLSGSAWI